MSAIAYNLKKYLKFIVKNVKIDAKAMGYLLFILKHLFRPQRKPLERFYFKFWNLAQKNTCAEPALSADRRSREIFIYHIYLF